MGARIGATNLAHQLGVLRPLPNCKLLLLPIVIIVVIILKIVAIVINRNNSTASLPSGLSLEGNVLSLNKRPSPHSVLSLTPTNLIGSTNPNADT